MKRKCILLVVSYISLVSCEVKTSKIAEGSKKMIAAKSPMGWNSWDCLGTSVTEAEVKSNADYMAKHLNKFGWEYIVIDFGCAHVQQYVNMFRISKDFWDTWTQLKSQFILCKKWSLSQQQNY